MELNTSTNTSTMKAYIRKGILGKTHKFHASYPKPKPTGAPQVEIKVHAAAINPVDYKVPKLINGPILGLDFCGTISKIHDNNNNDENKSNKFNQGDLVFGRSIHTGGGSLSEYTLTPPNYIAKAPQGWTTTDCAALPTAYLTSIQALRRADLLQLHEDDANNMDTDKDANKDRLIVIIGASGGCGLAAVQLSHAIGITHIIAICSERNHALVQEMGATVVVDYNNDDAMKAFLKDYEGKVDCVYDAASASGGGEDYWSLALPLLRKTNSGAGDKDGNGKSKVIGTFVAINGPPSKWIRMFVGWEKNRQHLMMTKDTTEDLELIVKLLQRTGAKPLTNVMEFNEQGLKDGFDLLKSRRARGKIVFNISDTST